MSTAARTGRPVVVVTRAVFDDHIDALKTHFDVRTNQSDQPIDVTEWPERLRGVDGLLCTGSDRIDAGVLDGADSLRAIATISVGTNHIDLEACRTRGVVVANTPDVLTETTADFGWALMMAAARRVTASERWLRDGHWKRWSLDQFLGADLHHATLGILGMGRIGQALARRAAGFSMQVLYHNRSPLPGDIEAACGAGYVTRGELLGRSDHLILVLPYTPEVHHTIDADALASMKPTATLTNIARGGLVDEDALVDALAEGRLAAAALDVYEGEPTVNPRLLSAPNVVLTPHLGSASRDTRRAMGFVAIDGLIAALAGREPRSRVA